VDATPARELDFLESDDIKQYSQELRLAATGERLDWIVGAFYSKDEVGISIPGGHEDLFLTRTLVTADQQGDVGRMAARLDLHEAFEEEGMKVAPPQVVFSASARGRRSGLRARRRRVL